MIHFLQISANYLNLTGSGWRGGREREKERARKKESEREKLRERENREKERDWLNESINSMVWCERL